MSRSIVFILAIVALIASVSQAFAPVTFGARTGSALEACRTNAKKEKRQRNRENMRKFQTKKRGPSRKKIMKKVQSNAMREKESEFCAKLFIASDAADE